MKGRAVMNTSELSALIHEASLGDDDAFTKLYAVVCRPLYKIARIALKTEKQAIEAIKLTVADSYAALPSAKINGNGEFVEWIVKILCTKIRHLYKKYENEEVPLPPDNRGFDIRRALISLQDIERLVLAVSNVCSCSAEKTAKLCGYTEQTVAVCLTNAEVTLKTMLLSYSGI